jgi:hypothetical protein
MPLDKWSSIGSKDFERKKWKYLEVSYSERFSETLETLRIIKICYNISGNNGLCSLPNLIIMIRSKRHT